jgi:hypothetical protein
MKKALVVLVLALAMAGVAAAQDFDIGSFPIGSWLDKNYDAVWDFSSFNITILDKNGYLVWDFGEKGIMNLGVSADETGVTLSFFCPDAGDSGKTYTITKGILGDNLTLRIERAEYGPYEVELTPFTF